MKHSPNEHTHTFATEAGCLPKPVTLFFWKLFAGGLRDGQDEKKETQTFFRKKPCRNHFEA